jgi:glycosyltransferase involved in cell wall biosynthesis
MPVAYAGIARVKDRIDPDDAVSVDVAVIIPAFNENAGVGPTVDRVRAALTSTSLSFEVVVVDDGSTDDTAEQAKARKARVIRQPENRGYGAALKTGILKTRSEYVLIIDADGTYPPEAIPTLLARMPDVDMAVGARASDDTSIARARRPAKKVLSLLASYLAGRRIPDLNSGLRVMRRSVLMEFLHILPSGFSFTTTITLALLCNNYVVSYFPITCAPRVGSSKLRAKEFSAFVMLVLRTVVLFNPLKVFLPLGAALFLIGAAKFVYDVFLWNLSETAVMAFLSAIIVWSVGLLADMIARVYLHQRGAP